MPTGFVERYKGKVAMPNANWVGGSNVYGVQGSTIVSGGFTPSGTTLSNAGVVLFGSSTLGVYHLAPPIPGVGIAFHALPQSSNWILTGSTVGVGAGFQNIIILGCSSTTSASGAAGSSITNTIKSTVSNPVSGQSFYLMGISSIAYLYEAGSTNGNLGFSTTT